MLGAVPGSVIVPVKLYSTVTPSASEPDVILADGAVRAEPSYVLLALADVSVIARFPMMIVAVASSSIAASS